MKTDTLSSIQIENCNLTGFSVAYNYFRARKTHLWRSIHININTYDQYRGLVQYKAPGLGTILFVTTGVRLAKTFERARAYIVSLIFYHEMFHKCFNNVRSKLVFNSYYWLSLKVNIVGVIVISVTKNRRLSTVYFSEDAASFFLQHGFCQQPVNCYMLSLARNYDF